MTALAAALPSSTPVRDGLTGHTVTLERLTFAAALAYRPERAGELAERPAIVARDDGRLTAVHAVITAAAVVGIRERGWDFQVYTRALCWAYAAQETTAQ